MRLGARGIDKLLKKPKADWVSRLFCWARLLTHFEEDEKELFGVG